MDVAVADRRTEAVRMHQAGVCTEEIRDALGYKDTKAVRSVIRRALGSATRKCTVPVRDPLEDGLPADVLTSRDRRVHRMIAQRARMRENRLEGLLRASGMTVAQMTTERLCGGATWLLRQWDA